MKAFDQGASDEKESKQLLGFQRDIVSKVGFLPHESSSSQRRSATALGLWNKNNKSDEEDNKEGESNKLSGWFRNKKEKDNDKKVVAANDDDDEASMWYKFASKFEGIREELSRKILSVLPAPVVVLLAKIFARVKTAIPSLKIAFLSFSAGAVLTLGAILVPVYSSVESLSQPVTLFETILADLEYGYVDPVDTNKLFETGIQAMLKSLDPYTEFEAKEEAQQMNEGIMGRYGGVGLVISGATPRDMTEIKKITEGAGASSSSSSSSSRWNRTIAVEPIATAIAAAGRGKPGPRAAAGGATNHREWERRRPSGRPRRGAGGFHHDETATTIARGTRIRGVRIEIGCKRAAEGEKTKHHPHHRMDGFGCHRGCYRRSLLFAMAPNCLVCAK